jgi:pyruvate dehydrogenase E2 component (dihydrolipoamide acetyltransferase)
MAHQIILPKLGQTMEEGAIVEWLKAEGDPVQRGEVLFTLESDKAVLEVEARAKGVLRKILVPAGVAVPIMSVVGIIAAPDEDISAALAAAGGVAPAARHRQRRKLRPLRPRRRPRRSRVRRLPPAASLHRRGPCAWPPKRVSSWRP